MTRGTTPTHTFKLPIETATIKTVRITYKQKDTVVFEKTEKDITMDKNVIRLKLQQKETLKLEAHESVRLQLKALTYDGTVLVSPVKTLPVDVILNEEVLE